MLLLRRVSGFLLLSTLIPTNDAQGLPIFNGEDHEDIRIWSNLVTNQCETQSLSSVECATLAIKHIGNKALEVLHELGIDDEEAGDADEPGWIWEDLEDSLWEVYAPAPPISLIDRLKKTLQSAKEHGANVVRESKVFGKKISEEQYRYAEAAGPILKAYTKKILEEAESFADAAAPVLQEQIRVARDKLDHGVQSAMEYLHRDHHTTKDEPPPVAQASKRGKPTQCQNLTPEVLDLLQICSSDGVPSPSGKSESTFFGKAKKFAADHPGLVGAASIGAGAVSFGIGGPLIIGAGLQAVGFGPAGPIAGGIAANIQRGLYGGAIPPGAAFGWAQAVAARGIPMAGKAVMASWGGVGGLWAATTNSHSNTEDKCPKESEKEASGSCN